MVSDMRGTEKLQAVLIVSHIYNYLFLAVFRSLGNVDMEGGFE